DTEPPALAARVLEHLGDPGAGLQRVVQRQVVLPVGGDELVGPRRVDRAHLLLERRAADAREQLVVRQVAAEHGARRVPERGEDQLPGVDDGPVEIEEDDGQPHAPIVVTLARVEPFEEATGALRARAGELGYLFLCGAIDPALPLALREEVLRRPGLDQVALQAEVAVLPTWEALRRAPAILGALE